MTKKEIVVYSFNELSKEAQDVAIENEIEFILETVDYNDMSPNMKKACDKSDSMRTPCFDVSYMCSNMWVYAKEEIIDGLRAMGDVFLKDGKYFNSGV